MLGRRGAVILDDLPEDIIIHKILIRLTARDVGRCRVVRASWRSATSTREFMLQHSQRQPALPIIDGNEHPVGVVVLHDVGAGARASTQLLWPFFLRPHIKFRYEIRLHATNDGFLIVSYESRFYICNPTIRKHALLPQPQFGQDIKNAIIGFYTHHPSGEYRVLWVSRHLSEAKLYILTMGCSKPRHVKVRLPTSSLPSVEQTLLNGLYNLLFRAPVHHRGNLHWTHYNARSKTGGGGDIVVFDTSTESFYWMGSPTKLGFWERLLDLKGMLAYGEGLFPDFTVVDVWVIKDYKAQIWTFKYRIDVSTIEASRLLGLTSLKEKRKRKRKTPLDSEVKFFREMIVLNEHELLIRYNNKYVLHCDVDGKFLRTVCIGKKQYCMDLTRHRFQESIIPIPSGEMQEEDEESPFS